MWMVIEILAFNHSVLASGKRRLLNFVNVFIFLFYFLGHIVQFSVETMKSKPEVYISFFCRYIGYA